MNKSTDKRPVLTLRCEIVKPLDMDWTSLARLLRTLRAPMHRVLNNTLTAMELAVPRGDMTHPRSLAYQSVVTYWAQERKDAIDRLAKLKVLAPYTGDDTVKRVEHERRRRAHEELSDYLRRIAETEPGSKVVLGTAEVAYREWKRWAKLRWSGAATLPTHRNGQPVAISGAGVKIAAQDGLAVLSLRLLAGRGAPVRIVVRPYGGHGFADMRRILNDPTLLGDVRITQETSRGKPKWQAHLSYRYEPMVIPAGRTMAVHRGVKNFLTVAVARSASGADAYTAIIETGADVIAHKQAYAARRRSLGQHGRQLGTGACGHGVARRHERVTRLMHGEENWVRTKCQVVAARVVRMAQKFGVSRILIEDWSNPAKDGAPELGEFVEKLVRQFPLGMLRESIVQASEKAGITVETRPGEYNSRTCPMCAHVHESGSNGTFHCEKCMLERPTDVIYVWNMLRREGLPVPLAEANAAEQHVVDALRAANVEEVTD